MPTLCTVNKAHLIAEPLFSHSVMKVAYPSAHVIEQLDPPLIALKIARHSPCSLCPDCTGLRPPPRVDVVDDRNDSSLADFIDQYGSDDEEVSSYLETCACGHGVKEHNADEVAMGHSEFARRGRVAVRLDELLQVCPICVCSSRY